MAVVFTTRVGNQHRILSAPHPPATAEVSKQGKVCPAGVKLDDSRQTAATPRNRGRQLERERDRVRAKESDRERERERERDAARVVASWSPSLHTHHSDEYYTTSSHQRHAVEHHPSSPLPPRRWHWQRCRRAIRSARRARLPPLRHHLRLPNPLHAQGHAGRLPRRA